MEIISTNTNTVTNGYGVTLGASMFSAGDLAIQYANGIDGTTGQFLTNSGPGVIKPETWTHFACVLDVSATEMKIYINGSLVTTGTKSYTFGNSNPNYALNIGRYVGPASGDGGYFNGWISDLRITKSTVYTANFTPPTAPLTAISGTELLTCTNKHEVWDAAGGSSLTLSGNAAASTAQYKWGNSMYFDGNGDQLFGTSSSLVSMGSGDYTAECWVYFNSLPSANNSFNLIFSVRDASNNGAGVYVDGTSPHIKIYTGSLVAEGTTTLSTGQWYHFAYVRNSGTSKVYIDGTQDLSYSYSTSVGDVTLKIAGDNTHYSNFYIEDMRITKGLARYTANFTPPTGSFEG